MALSRAATSSSNIAGRKISTIDCRRWAPDLSSPSGGGDCHARWKCGVTCCEAGDHHDSSRVLWQRRPGRMNRPGGNITGVVTLNIETGQKRLELGSTTARSGDEVALIADTISHYPPVLIASLSNNSSRRRPRKKTQLPESRTRFCSKIRWYLSRECKADGRHMLGRPRLDSSSFAPAFQASQLSSTRTRRYAAQRRFMR